MLSHCRNYGADMINENEPCLKMRNQTTRAEETYYKHYLKKFRGYLRGELINHQTVGLFFGIGALLALCLLTPNDVNEFGTYIKWTLFCIFVLAYIVKIAISLWFWKYAKHVVITNEGVWIMYYSSFWWSEDFTGKKRFLSPTWSLYGWSEIKITDSDTARPKSSVKISREFENFDYAVIKSCKLTSLFLTRFDGVQEIDFLERADADEILAYAHECKKRKKRKKKDAEIIEEDYEKLPDDEYTDDEE